MKKEILAIIPARGGSKGIKRKNMLLIEGVPLIQYTISAAMGCSLITRVMVNSDDKEIIEYASGQGVEVIVRPDNLAQDDTPMKEVIDYQLAWLKEKENYVPDMIVLLQPTSPLRTASHIEEALTKMIHSDCDAMVSVVEEPHLHSPFSVMKINEEGYLEFFMKEGSKYTRRQDKPKFYARNGAAIYAVDTKVYQQTGSLYGTKCIPFEMLSEDSVDIDEPLDVYMVKSIMQYKHDKERNRE